MVRDILDVMAGAYTVEKILAAYPEPTQETVLAALEYAADVMDGDSVQRMAGRG